MCKTCFASCAKGAHDVRRALPRCAKGAEIAGNIKVTE